MVTYKLDAVRAYKYFYTHSIFHFFFKCSLTVSQGGKTFGSCTVAEGVVLGVNLVCVYWVFCVLFQIVPQTHSSNVIDLNNTRLY